MKRQLCLRLTMFLTLIFLSGSLAGATFYVSKTDSGIQGAAATDGTEKRPFSTIANAVALAKAQIEMLHSTTFSHPRFWAAFQIVGIANHAAAKAQRAAGEG